MVASPAVVNLDGFQGASPRRPEGPLGRVLGAGLTGRLGRGLVGLTANDLITQFTVSDLVEGNVHKSHAGADGDHRAVAEAKLADALGDDVDEDLGVCDLGKGAMDKF